MTDAAEQIGRPRFTIVSAVYNVARYLDDFIGSLEAQEYPHELIQVVAVDDGSTDESLVRLQRWQGETQINVVVLTKENGGQSTARNLGLDHATGDWVTFTDPDDMLSANYFQRCAAFLRKYPETDLIATKLFKLHDQTGEVRNSHPLRVLFRDGDVARRLSTHGDYFYGSAPASLFRADRLRELGLRFDERIRPTYEDGHLLNRYLLACDDPVVGFLGSAEYHYRERSDGTATLQGGGSLKHPGRFLVVPRLGYLDLIRIAEERFGAVPRWLQTHLVYELSWYVSSGLLNATVCRGEIAEEFNAMAAEILGHIDDEVLDTFSRRRLRPEWKQILRHGYRDVPWHSESAQIIEYDAQRGLALLSYHVTGELPDELIEVSGRVLEPRLAKTREFTLYERLVLRERLIWIPTDGTVQLTLGGRPVPIGARRMPDPATALLPMAIRSSWAARPSAPTAEQTTLLRQASGRLARRRYRDAWVFVDRLHDADDSAEHLFHHVRSNHPEINAWFVVDKESADWRRLKQAGVKRLVAPGTQQWKLLMINARHLISSHADVPIIKPAELDFPGASNWSFSFLQHGVIKDDLSEWLNRKKIDVFVTSTRAEYDSIAGDGSRYMFTPKEVVLSGMPRFDKVREAGLAVPPDKRDLVLLTPTWRNWLTTPFVGADTQKRAPYGAEFFESDFVRNWMALICSPELHEACERQSLKVGFLPHPNLQSALPDLDLPAWVEPLVYEGNDVRALFARAALLVTDYSSVAFNAAYMDRPVVYFQFDADRMFGGEHVGRGGYFDYRRDGFGPVAETLEQAVKEIGTVLDAGRDPLEPYASRIAATFPVRDGGCSERTFQAILASTEKVTSKDLAARS